MRPSCRRDDQNSTATCYSNAWPWRTIKWHNGDNERATIFINIMCEMLIIGGMMRSIIISEIMAGQHANATEQAHHL